MNNLPPTIGVIIVSYNTASLLGDCLRSLRACTLPLHIHVIDNASSDTSVDLVRTDFPEVELCALDHNVGFAAANNLGLHALGFATQVPHAASDALPDYVLLLNPDTVVQAGAIEALTTFLCEHPRVGMVGPRLLNPDGSVQTGAFRFPTLMMSLLDVFPPGDLLPGRLYNSWWHGRYAQEQVGMQPFPIDHPLGACMLVRRAVVQNVGLLDEQYFMYSEEIDWCWRIRRAGWAIWQVPHAHVMHVGGAATSQFRSHMLVELHRSRIRFFSCHYTHTFVRTHRMITRAGMLFATLRSWVAYRRRRIDQAKLRERLWAYGLIWRE